MRHGGVKLQSDKSGICTENKKEISTMCFVMKLFKVFTQFSAQYILHTVTRV
jgi:hypothetical protein